MKKSLLTLAAAIPMALIKPGGVGRYGADHFVMGRTRPYNEQGRIPVDDFRIRKCWGSLSAKIEYGLARHQHSMTPSVTALPILAGLYGAHRQV